MYVIGKRLQIKNFYKELFYYYGYCEVFQRKRQCIGQNAWGRSLPDHEQSPVGYGGRVWGRGQERQRRHFRACGGGRGFGWNHLRSFRHDRQHQVPWRENRAQEEREESRSSRGSCPQPVRLTITGGRNSAPIGIVVWRVDYYELA